jgi:hypothetical protein
VGVPAAVAGATIEAKTTEVAVSRAAASERNLIVADSFLDDGPEDRGGPTTERSSLISESTRTRPEIASFGRCRNRAAAPIGVLTPRSADDDSGRKNVPAGRFLIPLDSIQDREKRYRELAPAARRCRLSSLSPIIDDRPGSVSRPRQRSGG